MDGNNMGNSAFNVSGRKRTLKKLFCNGKRNKISVSSSKKVQVVISSSVSGCKKVSHGVRKVKGATVVASPGKSTPEKDANRNIVTAELQNLTQFEEMLIARAFPVIQVYTKARGGQRAYKGHVLTLPQDVQQLADILPRCAKDLPVIIIQMYGKEYQSQAFRLRRQAVADALHWFAYWAYNLLYRWRLLGQSNIFIRQNPGDAALTTEQLTSMLLNNDHNYMMSKLLNYAKNISGTNAYWNQKKQNLQSIIEQKGPPTIFWTLSCADFHWPEFHSLFGENLQSSNFRSNVLNNPHIFDWLFTERVKSFVKWWLYKTLGAEWHWYRYEFAVQRGSIHCHGVAKLQDDPGLCKLTQIALKGFLAKQKKNGQVTNSGEVTIEQLQQQIDEGLQAEKVICCYTDSLLSTWNNNNPEEMQWIKPDVHPCKQRFSDITEQHLDDDYEDLLNTVQRHTICNSLYCLKRRNDEKLQCRFDFPVRQCEYTHLEFESVNTKDKSIRYRAKVVTARNDTRLNRHQRIQLQGWRANCDINVVIDYHACIEYLAKYTSKGEKISNVARDAFISVVRSIKSTSDSGNTSKKIKQLMMKAVGQRDMSIQEVMHQTLSLNLFSSSFEVVSVSFDGIRRLTNEDGEVVTHTSLLDNYAFRKNFINDEPAIVSLNFIQFTSKFVVKNERLHKRKSDVVVQTFPRYSSSPQSSNYGLYCKYQLLKYKPWSNTLSSAWNNEDDTNEVFVTHWNNFLHTPNIHCYVPEWNRELTNICTYFQNSDDDEQFHENNEAAEPEEWMLLSNHHSSTEASSQYFSVNSETDFEYWQQGQKSYSQEEIGNMPSWIDSQKQINNLAEATANVFSDFDVGSLNDEQSKAAN
eukprot:gene3598-13017_t